MIRISTKRLEDRIRVINSYTNNKYDIKLQTTTGCGVDLKINDVWVTDELGIERNLTNKETMKILDERFNEEIRSIVLSLNN